MAGEKEQRKQWERLQQQLTDRLLSQEAEDRPGLPAGEEARQSLVERQIRAAMESGAFDNLPGRGKPLPLNTNPYLEPGQELAFNLLKNNGFAPDWIERDQAIRHSIEQARGQLGQAWQRYQATPAGRAAWQTAIDRFAGRLAELNRQIDDFNLVTPVLSCQRPRLQLADEVRRVLTAE